MGLRDRICILLALFWMLEWTIIEAVVEENEEEEYRPVSIRF